MSGHEVFAAVAAIVAAFRKAADLVVQLKRKEKRQSYGLETRDEYEAGRRKLQVSLQTAETQIAYHYAAMYHIGDAVRIGDGISRERLHYIIIVMQTDIVGSLQSGVEYENAVLDLPMLHEAAITNRKSTIETLDELKHRIILEQQQEHPPSAPPLPRQRKISGVSVLPTRDPPLGKHDSIQVSIPAEGTRNDSQNDGLVRPSYEQRRKEREVVDALKTRSSLPPPSSSTHDFHPALNFLLQSKTNKERTTIMERIDELLLAYQSLHYNHENPSGMASLKGQSRAAKRDTLAMLMGIEGDDSDKAALDQAALEFLRSPTLDESQKNRAESFSTSHPANNSTRVPTVRRWSNSSSVYSVQTITSDPPSLYRYGSASSRESDAYPAEPPSPTRLNRPARPQSSQHPGTTFWDMSHHLQTSTSPARPDPTRSQTLEVAQLSTRSRLTAPVPTRSSTLEVGHLATRSRPTTPATTRNANKPLPPIPHDTNIPTLHDVGHLMPEIDHLQPEDMLFRTAPHSSAPTSRPTTPISRPITPCVVTTITSQATEKIFSGRPCKENDYWGFCKATWAIREDLHKGLSLESRPTGYYNTTQVWQCKHCYFEGSTHTAPHPTKKHKKEILVDQKIYKSSVGIRYRWLFLAKSHIRQTNPPAKGVENTSYGCVICTAEKCLSGVFGGVETLMNHIFMEHARPGRMRDATLKQVNCILGRTAGADEEWDLNIPNEETCVLLF